MTSHYFEQKFTPFPPCHISSQVITPPSNITSQFATPLTFTITNFHLFCVCLDKKFICYIDLICARCDKTNILFENTAHIAKQKLSSKVFSTCTLLKTETNELRCAHVGND